MREIVKIKLGASEVSMRPTFEAYGDIEARLGALRPLYTRIVTAQATLAEMAAIVAIGARQVDQFDGREISEDKIAKLIFDAGVWDDAILVPLSDFLTSLGWTPDQRKKIEAEAARQAQTG